MTPVSTTPVPPRRETEPHKGTDPKQCIPCLDNQMTRSTAFRPVRDSFGDSDELVIIPTGVYRALQRSKWVEAMYATKIQEGRPHNIVCLRQRFIPK
jgi:hypothetical protein